MPLVNITDSKQINTDHIESVLAVHIRNTKPKLPRHKNAKAMVEYHNSLHRTRGRTHPMTGKIEEFQKEIDERFKYAMADYTKAMATYEDTHTTTYKIVMVSGREYHADRDPGGQHDEI